MQTKSIAPIGLVIALLALGGCSIFEPFHTSGSSNNVEDLLGDARNALDEGHYDKAMAIMDKAMGIAPMDPRVRYVHAVSAVKSSDIDMLDVVEILQPQDGNLPVDAAGERVLIMSDAELENLYDAFQVVSADLEPLVEEIAAKGRELPGLRDTEDVFMSYGVSETIVGMLRVLDNDETDSEFSPDDRLVIVKFPKSYDIRVEDLVMSEAERDFVIDQAIERTWDRFVKGRRAFFLYYQFAVNGVVWTHEVPEPPDQFPRAIDTGNTVGSMVDFVDDGVLALYQEKEDLEVVSP
jgi:hypothetical protein